MFKLQDDSLAVAAECLACVVYCCGLNLAERGCRLRLAHWGCGHTAGGIEGDRIHRAARPQPKRDVRGEAKHGNHRRHANRGAEDSRSPLREISFPAKENCESLCEVTWSGVHLPICSTCVRVRLVAVLIMLLNPVHRAIPRNAIIRFATAQCSQFVLEYSVTQLFYSTDRYIPFIILLKFSNITSHFLKYF